jgi:pimeloyl-ACP methyl ester carboxylesterase
MARLGVLRVASTLRLMDRRRLAETLTLPPGIREMAQALEYRAQHSDVAYKERAAQDESLAQARAARPVPEVPLAVLTHGIPYDWQPPGVPQAAVEQAERAWRDRQAEMANSVLDSTLIVAERSGHAIPMEQPGAVVEAIDWAIAATQRSAC